MLNNIPIK